MRRIDNRLNLALLVPANIAVTYVAFTGGIRPGFTVVLAVLAAFIYLGTAFTLWQHGRPDESEDES